jgi:hypothetical protein
MDLVPISAPVSGLRQVASLFEIVDDVRCCPLRDPNADCDVAEPDCRVLGDALEHMAVVGHEAPRRVPAIPGS